MIRKILLLLLALCLPMGGIAMAESVGSGVEYFAKETSAIIANVVLFPFRLVRDILDPQPRPVLVSYPYPPTAVIAASPAAPTASSAVVSAPSVPASPVPMKDPLEVHIPNDNGSYTVVTLKKTEKGFLGPQGEFYADYPSVEHLKEKYSKK